MNDNKGKSRVINAKICFENLNCKDYKPGYLIVESNLKQEKEGSSIRELASFANIIIDSVDLNESAGTSSVYASVIVNKKSNMQKLYEWIKKYAGKDKVDTIAPGLLETLEEGKDSKEALEENSVASRFAKYRKLYEDEDAALEDEVLTEKDDKEETSTDTEPSEKTEEKEKDNADEKDDKEKEDDKEDDEEVELTAVVLEVKKGDEDKLKDELVEAGVDEDDIEILTEEETDEEGDKDENNDEETSDKSQNEDEEETEDDTDDKDDKGEDTVKVKVAVDSFDALKEYLEGKGFDLEEILGGEIVSKDSEDEEGDDDKEGDDEKDDSAELDSEFDGFDDLFK